MKTPALLGPDGKTALRDYAGYHGGAGGFGGQLRAWDPPSESADAALLPKEGANKQVISSQADSLIKISRIWADFFPANTSNQPI